MVTIKLRVRVVLAMCATLNLHLEQLDVKTAFLHGNLEEEIYMLQPEGFEEKEKKNLVCRLNKSLYDLKQVPRCWYKRFDSFIMCLGYNRLNADPCAYFKRSGDNNFVILLLYVYDMLVAGSNKDHIEELKAQLAREFEMKDLGSANKILGMQIHRDRSNRKIYLSQKNYLKKILSRFSMQDLGSLMFAMICTRPDIAQAVGVVSRYMTNPGKEHWNTVKRIMRYIKGTSNVALCYGGSNLLINGYVDSDYVGDLDKSKSTTGYVFKVAGGDVSWVSKLQSVVAISTTEAEYVAATQASKEAIWLKILLEELGHNQDCIFALSDSRLPQHFDDLMACSSNDISVVRKLLGEDGCLVHARNYDNRMPLHVASLHGWIDIAKCLPESGADVNAQDRWKNTPLADAEGAKKHTMIELLKSYGGLSYGSFGEILKASWRGTPVAVKRILSSLSDDKLVIQDLRHEVKGDLHQHLKEKGALSASSATNFALDIAMNVFLVNSSAEHLKVGDFGLSKLIKIVTWLLKFSSTGDMIKKVNVFSFVVILYEMLEGDPPFSNYDPYEAAKYAAAGQPTSFSFKIIHPRTERLLDKQLKYCAWTSGIADCFLVESFLSSTEKCWADMNQRPFLDILKRLEGI
ncbi:hypothetical protein F3Y22_tig00111220pilonHSYRG00128 [Hibiscus syriacus]|uniref:Reverse transcriptase Ty1/copia-type domain-containing protein n=1 Tax=Hibiscus syriacus TaxID=106335 RepID=A0A6A2YUG8_HIBSY|nr:hypothetical protein F3Y22_tig00111220pilonHSYRG00128 [Hibiscus syriacus]